jgi:hypothetical protein
MARITSALAQSKSAGIHWVSSGLLVVSTVTSGKSGVVLEAEETVYIHRTEDYVELRC